MIRLGLTGGIGSGKTTIAKLFEALNVPVYYSDFHAKRLMSDDPELRASISDLLGSESYASDGGLNRSYISKQIFQNQAILDEMNALVHPAVSRDFDRFCQVHQNENLVIEESAILFETKLNLKLDKTILVVADENERIKRVEERDNIEKADILAKISKQMSDADKRPLADFIIENNNQEFIIPKVLEIYNMLDQ